MATTVRPHARPALRAPGLDWLLMAAVLALLVLGSLLVWSATSARDDLTGGDPIGVPPQAAGQRRASAWC